MSARGKVLFIIHDVYQEANILPLGPAYMSAILKEKGVDVRIACQDVYHYTNEELAEKFLKTESYDLIGVGFLAARFRETVIDLCRVINEYKKDAWLVLGSHGASPIPEYVLNTTGADVVAIGEAEETLPELLECKISGGRNLDKIAGIAYRRDGKVIVTKRRSPVRDLDSLPLPARELFPMDRYSTCFKFPAMDDDDRALCILTSRGCINRCNFCYRMEKGVRVRDIGLVVDEMKDLNEKYGITYFPIQDELFITSKSRILEFGKLLKKNGLNIRFDCNARVDIFDDEIADCLKESGGTLVNFGMESSDQNVLDLMSKRTSIEQNIRAARIAKARGLAIGLNFIWGNIGDTADSLKGNVRLIKEFNSYYQLRTIRPVTPYPGCDLYYEAIRRGLLKGPADFFEKFKNSDLLLVNFTDIPDDEFYQLLFEANKELIIDHFEHTSKDMAAAEDLIRQFYNLYFEGNFRFRGARHYERKT